MLIPGGGVSGFALSEIPDGSSVVEAQQTDAADSFSEDAEQASDDGDSSETEAPPDAAANDDENGASSSRAEGGASDVSADDNESSSADPDAADDKAGADIGAENAQNNDGTGDAEAEELESEEIEADAGILEYKADDYTVTLEYGSKAGIPEGTVLDVREVLADSKDGDERKEYSKYYDKALEQLRSDKGGDSIAKLGFARFYDIMLIADGREIEPEGDVKVTFTYDKDARESVYSEANKASGKSADDAVKVVHLTESDKTGELEAAAVDSKDTDLTVEKKELAETAFTTDSFSVYGIVYTVDFEYEGHTFSIEGESDILLSDVFARLDIEEDVKDVQEVTFTDPELIKAEAVDAEGNALADGADSTTAADWKLTSLKPFDTTETLTVRLPEKIIEITVTDAQSGNTFTLCRTRENTGERFRTRVYASRAGVTATQVGNQDTALHHNDTYGWMDLETVLSQYYSDYAQPRYSVISARDSTNRIDLCAIGFAESRVSGVFHGTFGLYTQQGATGQRANGSAAEYDLDITLNDNSLPVQVYVDGDAQVPEIFVNNDTSKTQYTAEELAEALGYQGYVVSSSTIGGTDVGSVSVNEMTSQSLAGNTFGIGRTSVTLVYDLAWINYQFNDGFNYTYNKAYQWTYSGGNVGDTPYEIYLETPIARVSNDGGATWTYHSYLVNPTGTGSAQGAFDRAKSLTGDVIIETLLEDHPRYVLPSATTFTNNADITLRTTDDSEWNPDGFISTIHRGWDGGNTAAQAFIYLNNANTKFTTENITFDGTDGTNQHTGRAIHVASGSLTVKDGSTFRNFSTPNVGGAIYSAQVKNTKIQGSEKGKILFENCRATGSSSDYDGGGAIAFIQGTKDAGRVEGAKFVDCYTDAAGGAIYVRTSSGASSFIVTNCEFDGHENLDNIAANRVNAKWGGAIYIWDGWFALSDSDFTDCTATEDGGAVSVHSGGGDKVEYIENCTFKGHDTLSPDIVNAKTGGAVGLTNVGNGTDLIRNITVTDCLTSGVGGGFYVNCELRKLEGKINFSNCSTTNGNGGGMYINTLQANAINESTHQTQLIFDNCHAGGGSSNGGGICFNSTPGPTTITGAVFTDCSAGSNGGSIYLPGSNSKIFKFVSCEFNGHDDDLPGTGANVKANAKNGGAIYINDGSLEFEGCNFTNLTVTGNGGAINMNGGGGDHITLTNCTINGHDENLDPGIKNASEGGGIWINADNGTTLNDVTIKNCQASGNGGGIYDSDKFSGTSGTVLFKDCYTTGGSGGGAYFAAAATFGDNVIFDGCHDDSTSTANGGGGAWFNSTVTLNSGANMTFDSCYSASYGGGAWFNAATTLNNGTINFNECYAAKRGGGAYFVNTATLNNIISFTNCHTDNAGTSDGGGGVWFQDWVVLNANAEMSYKDCYTASNGGGANFNAAATMNNGSKVTFDACHASSNGGGAYFKGAATLNNQSASFKDCYAGANGGGAYFAGNNANTLTGITFTDCKAGWDGTSSAAGGNGGGLYKASNTLNLTDTTFEGCYASSNGGAIYYAASTSSGTALNLNSGTVITDCTVEDGGRGTAVFFNSNGLGNFKDGVSITNNTGGGAVEVNNNGAILTFSGNVLVYDNTASGDQKNVVLDRNTNTVIKTATTGLGSGAHIGVYVTDPEFGRHGEVNDPFGTWQTTDINLEKFTNDRDDKLFGVSHPGDNLIYWGKIICKIIDVNGGEHVFPTLNSAVKHARTYQTDYVDGVCTVQMLVDYVIPQFDLVTLDNSSDNFVFTTAATEDNLPDGEEYFFEPTFTQAEGRLDTDSRETAIFQRGWDGGTTKEQSLFYVNNSSAKITTTNIIIDGMSPNTSGTLAQRTGRAIYANSGSMVLGEGSTFRNFSTAEAGGAVYAQSISIEGTVDNGVSFENCKTTGSGKSGGAIYAGGNVVAEYVTFTTCTATGTGGAIHHNGTGTVNVGHATFGALKEESASIPAAELSSADVETAKRTTGTNGGAIYSNTTGNFTLTDCAFYGSYASGSGGAVYLNASSANIKETYTDCVFIGCETPATTSTGTNYGGAIGANSSGGTIHGETNLIGCVFNDCKARLGGAVLARGNTVNVEDTVFNRCSASTYYGGAIYADHTGTKPGVTVTDSSFKDCTAPAGGALANSENGWASLTVTDSTFDGCKATGTGSYINGGAIADRAANTVSIKIKDSDFTNCTSARNGGAIWNKAPMSLDSVTIDGHTDGGLNASTANAQYGGAIYADNNVTIKDGVISNCSASNADGGAVYMNAQSRTIYFEGAPVVYGNPSTSTATGSQKNVVLQYNSNTVIQTTSNGLTGSARIGIYVTGTNPTTNTNDQFYRHGRLGAPYGTYGKDGDYTYFINDRLSTDEEPVRGSAKKATDATNIMYWAINHIPAPTDVDNNYLPYIFALIAGLALAAMAAGAKRRRSAEEE